MALPQFGIFAQGTIAHEFIEFDLRPDVDPATAGRALGRLRAPAVAAGGVNLVIGFGADFWRAIAPGDAPPDLASFQPQGRVGGHHAPATQHDFWLWINGSSRDVVYEHARAASLAVADVAVVATDVPAFVHRDSRDLTGFIDGSANPALLEAPRAALVPDGQPGEGGSIAVVMRWIHDLAKWEQLSVQEQERAVGRSKPSSVEFTGDRLPPTAHIARTQIHDDAGDEIPIYRRSVPYGTIAEAGLYFVAFAADRARLDRMLGRIFGTGHDGLHDRLADFTRPVSGAYYYAPSLTWLAAQGEAFDAADSPAGENVPGVPEGVRLGRAE
jgi:putative iron-dependent peroxidase